MTRSGIAGVLIKLVNSAVVFAVSVVLAKTLGPERFGIYSYVFALVMLLTVVVSVGLPELLVREIASYKLEGQWTRIKGIIAVSDRIVFGVTAVVLAISISFIARRGADLTQNEMYTSCFALLLIPVIAFASLRSSAIRANGNVVVGLLPVMLLRPLGFLILLTVAFLLDHEISPASAMALHLVAGILALLFAAQRFNLLLPQVKKVEGNTDHVRKWIKDALPFTMLAGVMVLDSNIDVIMLGWLARNEDVGIYRVASQTVIVVSFVLSALSLVASPQIARLYRSGDMRRLQRMVTIGGRLIAVVGVPAGIILIIWGDLFLIYVFGESFAAASMPLSILCVGHIVNSLMGLNGTVLNMTHYASESAWIVAGSAILNVILNIWLIPLYGTAGAAIATTSSMVLWNVLLSWRVYYQLGINATIFRR